MRRSLVTTRDAVLSGSHWFVSRYRAQPFPSIAGTWSAGSPSRHFHRMACVIIPRWPCWADLPG